LRLFTHFTGALTMAVIAAAILWVANPAGGTPVTSGLTLWLDGSDIDGGNNGATGDPLNGASGFTWADKSGNGNHANIIFGTPTYTTSSLIGGAPGVVFDGNDYFRTTTTAGPTDGFTMFSVFEYTGGNNLHQMMIMWGDEPTGNRRAMWRTANGIAHSFNGAARDVVGTLTTPTGSDFIGMVQKASGSNAISLQLNGVTGGSGSPALSAIGASDITIGANNAGNERIQAHIAEVLIYNTPLTAGEISQVGNYLESKYGVAWIDTFQSAATGDWSSASTWDFPPPAGGPAGDDQVIIQSGHDVGYDTLATGSIGAVTINSAAGTSSLVLSQNLDVSGTVLMQGGNLALLDLNGHKLTADKLEIMVNTSNQNGLLPVLQRTGGGTLDVGTLSIHNGGSTTYTLDPGDVIRNLRTEASGLAGNSGIDVVTSSVGNITESVYIGWHGINELKLGADLNISGGMTLERGTLVSNGYNVTVGGNWIHGTGQGGTFNRAGGGTLTLNGSLTPDWNDGGGGTFSTLPGDAFNGTVNFGWVQTNANSFLDMTQSTGDTTGVTFNGNITDQIWDRGQYAIRLFFDGATTGTDFDWGMRWQGNRVATLTTWDNRSDGANVGDLTLQYSGGPAGVQIFYSPGDDYTYVGYGSQYTNLVWDDGNGDWALNTNWDPDFVPISASLATIGNGGTANVNTAGQTVGTLNIDNGGANINAAGELTVTRAINVAAGQSLNVAGTLNAPTINTAGNTSFTNAAGNIGDVNVTGGTTNVEGTTLGGLNVTGGTVNVQSASTATNLMVDAPTASVQISGGNLTTSNGELHSGLVSTSNAHALVVADGGQLKVGSGVNIHASGATAQVRGGDVINPTAAQRNTLSLTGGTITVSGGIGNAGAAADTTNLKHQWTFNDGTMNDSINSAHGVAENANVFVQDGRLRIANTGRMLTAASGSAVGVRTLMAWVSLENLNQFAGSALTIENDAGGGTFDGIIYGERTGRQWMNGSNSFVRSPVSNGGALETVTEPGEVMMAIVYNSDNSITLYRDGALYGNSYTQGTLVTYTNPVFQIGRRHGTNNSWIDAWINEARVYNTALSGAQIFDIYNSFYTQLDINMPDWDVEVNHTTTLELDTTGSVTLGDLIVNLEDHSLGDTILEILSGASSISWDNLIVNGPADAGEYVLVDWSDQLATSDPFFDGMFSSVSFNGLSGALTYLDHQILLQVLGSSTQAVPEPSSVLMWAVIAMASAVLFARRDRSKIVYLRTK